MMTRRRMSPVASARDSTSCSHVAARRSPAVIGASRKPVGNHDLPGGVARQGPADRPDEPSQIHETEERPMNKARLNAGWTMREPPALLGMTLVGSMIAATLTLAGCAAT